MSAITEQPATHVDPDDVLVVVVPHKMSIEEKQKYVHWFREAIKGTVLEPCRLLLLDGGVQLELYKGPKVTATPAT